MQTIISKSVPLNYMRKIKSMQLSSWQRFSHGINRTVKISNTELNNYKNSMCACAYNHLPKSQVSQFRLHIPHNLTRLYANVKS